MERDILKKTTLINFEVVFFISCKNISQKKRTMKKNIFIILIIVSFSACTETYRSFQKIEDMKWHKSDVKIFKVEIEESGNYDLTFAFRYATLYPFKNIKVTIAKKTPKGEILTKDAEFMVVDENNKYIGDVGGDIWDLENYFAQNEFLEKGEYEFYIQHNMQNDPVIVVMEVGLIIEKHNE